MVVNLSVTFASKAGVNRSVTSYWTPSLVGKWQAVMATTNTSVDCTVKALRLYLTIVWPVLYDYKLRS